MGQKSRALQGNSATQGSLEKRKKDKTVLVLDGLVSDLARRTQAAIEGSGPDQHFESIRAIHRLLGQIQKLERPFVSHPNVPDGGLSASARMKILENWLRFQGVPIQGLKLEGGLREGAGIIAQQAVQRGDLLCAVPARVMMTTATAIRSKDDVGLIFKADPILRQMPTLILALHLLFEKHRPADDPSNWTGYIVSLPGQGVSSDSNSDNTDNFIMPLAFSLETIEALKGTAVLVEMHKILRNSARQYAHIRLLLKQLRGYTTAIERANDWFTWAEFRWAASIVMTRQNPIPGTPDMETGQALALIPYLDMFNHEEGDITCHFAVQYQQMELIAKRDFKAGEQVYISYGFRPNSALLLYSGFVPDHNSKDRIKIPVELRPSDPFYSKKAALLKWLELPVSGWLELFHDGTPSPELATWVKVAIIQDLSVLTENLRAAIASRAQETAAILEYKAALREAEEKARNVGLPQIEPAIAEMVNTLGIEGNEEPIVLQTENGSLEVEGGDTVMREFLTNDEIVLESKEDGVSEPQNGPAKHPSKVSELEDNSGGDGPPSLGEVSDLQIASGVDDVLQVGASENSLDEQETIFDEQEQILGEHLFPAEASLLSEICRLRIMEYGSDFHKNPNGSKQERPHGLGGGGLVSGKSAQSKNQSKELLMALKIRQQEQLALSRAIDRGSNCQYSHSKGRQPCH